MTRGNSNAKSFFRKKACALFMLFVFLFSLFEPSVALALTSGPSQPEVQSFEPVGTSDMVDLFSGDFNYNIPLLDVDGYPINISYHSGITMDQEASWVGLGWNINPGVINRNVRGIPDDFKGDVITKKFNMKQNQTYGVSFGVGTELFGLDFLKLSLSMGIKYNNYTGIGAEQSVNLSINCASSGKGPLTGSLGLTSSSDDGVTIAPSVSMQANVSKADKISLGVNIGTSFNTRAGLKGLTISANLSQTSNVKKTSGKTTKTGERVRSMGIGSVAFDFTQPTYTPKVDLPLNHVSFTGRFTIGGEIAGINVFGFVSGYYANQFLSKKKIDNPAFGYLNLDEGIKNTNSLLDFNREKDGSYTKSTPALPLPIQTFDTYSVSGQGVGGSYRPYRSDLGYVCDPNSSVTSGSGTVGLELGVGNIFKVGVDINANMVSTKSGNWKDENFAQQRLQYKSNPKDPLYEKVYFKEANEKSVDSDPDFLAKMGGTDPQAIALRKAAYFYTIADDKYASQVPIQSTNYRKSREHRNQEISMLSKAEVASFGYDNPDSLNRNPDAPAHHTAEIATYSTDGRRYIYGLAAYNKAQKEVSFATGGNAIDTSTNLVSYSGTDNSESNELGTDHYFNEVSTPQFAHGYLLTAVLSADYIDADGVQGPSNGDFGSWTKIHYAKIDNFKWRTPIEANRASNNEGLRTVTNDDKGNYLYGEKELYYVDRIETKNYVAIFNLEARGDAYGVTGENGGVNSSIQNGSRLLRSISLYSKPDYYQNGVNALPIKKVNFEYDYSLCKGVKNSNYSSSYLSDPIDKEQPSLTPDRCGKLTLRKIFFTYQKSEKGRLSPYQFDYSGVNPDYSSIAYDRWGNYKYTNGNCSSSFSNFSYVVQDKGIADSTSSAWTLKTIGLPSGGTINVNFESDDYSFVQNKPAAQMFVIEGAGASLDNSLTGNQKLYFKLQKREDGTNEIDINKYVPTDSSLIYFRFLVHIVDQSDSGEYISGYAKIKDRGIETLSSGQYGFVQFEPVGLDSDNGSNPQNPIIRTAIQYARINLPKSLWSQPSNVDNKNFGLELIKALIESYSVLNELVVGPNTNAFNHHRCETFVKNKSWIRLNNPIQKKYGGGCRVKSISLNNEWRSMTDTLEAVSIYGQEYDYRLDDGSSSGVAAYEPLLGGDENPLRVPYYYSIDKLWVPDDQQYMEEPFGEGLYPGASVGYARVTVRNLQHEDLHRHATGKVVHEFYTSKDFPTISRKTEVSSVRDKTNPWSFASIFHIDSRDYMTASQGFSVEVNDMHGKPKSQMVYSEGQREPISSIEYKYKQVPYGTGSAKLENQATVIFQDGSVSNRNIGLNVDMVSDFRESKTNSMSAGVQLNLDGFSLVIIPLITIPAILPSMARSRVQFRSAVTTKLIQRFGLIDEIIAKDLGSTVSTKNLAYDSESGEVILTQTTQDFNDPVYSYTFPAYWYYDGMAPTSRNQGAVLKNVEILSGSESAFNISDAKSIFTPGDELALYTSGGSPVRAWVNKVTAGAVTLIDHFGNNIPAGILSSLKIIRSGHRNQQSLPMAQLTTLVNPLQSIFSNAYSKVVSASAIEYSNSWKTFCNCFDNSSSGSNTLIASTNPYILGTKGYWKPQKSYLYLTDRTQAKYNNNTNIRRDGIFTAFTPFYKFSEGRWIMDYSNWTYTSEVTEFSPFGPELENRDALGKYSAATFGFNQTLSTSVSANSRYSDIGFDSFEDYGYSECADNHFKITPVSNALPRISHVAHSGRNSLKVNANDSVVISKQLKAICDVQPDCDVNLCYEIDNLSAGHPLEIFVNQISTLNGDSPFSLEWEVTGGVGQKSIVLIQNGLAFTDALTPGESFFLDLTFTFQDGCIVHKHLNIKKEMSQQVIVSGTNLCVKS